jgi:hypothetical protein
MALFHRRKFLFGLAGAVTAVAGILGARRANAPQQEPAAPELALGPQIPLPPGLTPPSALHPPPPGYASYTGIRAS